MEKSKEQAVWERVTGEGPLGPQLLEIMARKTEDARLFRELAAKMPARQKLLREMAGEISEQVRLLSAAYYVLTEQKPKLPNPKLPKIPGGSQGILLLLRRADGARPLPGNCTGGLRQTMEVIGEQDGLRYRRLLGLLAGMME